MPAKAKALGFRLWVIGFRVQAAHAIHRRTRGTSGSGSSSSSSRYNSNTLNLKPKIVAVAIAVAVAAGVVVLSSCRSQRRCPFSGSPGDGKRFAAFQGLGFSYVHFDFHVSMPPFRTVNSGFPICAMSLNHKATC